MSKFKFCIATPEEHEAAAKNRTGFARPLSLSPLEAYLGLKALFGEPNRQYIDETAQQWVFLIKTKDAQIEVNDWKLETWSIHVYDQENNADRSEDLIKELEKQITHAFAKHRSLLADILKSPAGHVIENPFALYYRTAQELIEIAEKLHAKDGTPSSAEFKLGDRSTHYTICRAAVFNLIAAIEGLLNLLYETYLKADLRDDRIVQRLAREQIDVKLRLAPIYCDCFIGKPIDHTTEAFRNFNRLVNSRNDFIHANVAKGMKIPIVSYDEMTFIVSPENLRDSVLPSLMRDIGIEEASKIKAIVDAIVAQLLSNMKPRDRRGFESVIFEEFINVEYHDGVPIILC